MKVTLNKKQPKDLISLELSQRENCPLIGRMVFQKPMGEEDKKIELNIDGFVVFLFYEKEEKTKDQFIYWYRSFNPSIFEEFLRKEEEKIILGNNILNDKEGFLFIDPNDHQVTIYSLLGEKTNFKLEDYGSNILKIRENINNSIENIRGVLETEEELCYKEIKTKIPKNYWDLIDSLKDLYEIEIIKIKEEYVDISIILPLLVREVFVINFLSDSCKNQGAKQLYFSQGKEKVNLLFNSLKSAYIYKNKRKTIEVNLNKIPWNLNLKENIKYKEDNYVISSFTIQLNNKNSLECKIIMHKYTPLKIKEKLEKKQEEKNLEIDFYSIFKINNNKIYIKEAIKQTLTKEETYFILEK